LSPNVVVSGCEDSDATTLFLTVAKMLAPMGLAFLELREASSITPFGIVNTAPLSPLIRRVYPGCLILNESYDRETASLALRNNLADALALDVPLLQMQI
jgi:N-ethylmaleimide reductase